MKKLKLILFAGLISSVCAWAKIPVVSVSELIPNAKHSRATEVIIHVIESYHYKKKRLDDALSSEILDNYLDSLDQNRSFFTNSDIKQFETYRNQLDDKLENSDLSPAFKIFKLYRRRVEERTLYALEVLESEFDFNLNEDYMFDKHLACLRS